VEEGLVEVPEPELAEQLSSPYAASPGK